MKTLQSIAIISAVIHYVCSQIAVISPPKFIQTVGKSSNPNDIPFKLGNFGEIPYGKTVAGYLIYHPSNDGSNTWCDFEKTSVPTEMQNLDSDYVPLYLVDHSEDCHYTQKAYNVKARGGKVMILASDDETYKKKFNVDDQLGIRVDIPSIIIQKSSADLFRQYLSQPIHDKIIISVKFTGEKENGFVELDMFFRSDDIKALHFFTEFQTYYEKLKSKLIFAPVYKYYQYSFEPSSSSLSSNNDTSPCIKNGKLCGTTNPSMKINNARIILLENLRQSCIYLTTSEKTLDTYWNYMTKFSDDCADVNNLVFNEDCATAVMDSLKIDAGEINNCMENEIKNNGKAIFDYEIYEELKVRKIPELYINGIKYKGTWYGKYIFESICSGFLDDPSICSVPVKPVNEDSGLGVGTILIIGFTIFFITIILLYCYRRIANKSLEASLNDKIRSQTIQSLTQYKVFTEEETKGNKKLQGLV